MLKNTMFAKIYSGMYLEMYLGMVRLRFALEVALKINNGKYIIIEKSVWIPLDWFLNHENFLFNQNWRRILDLQLMKKPPTTIFQFNQIKLKLLY